MCAPDPCSKSSIYKIHSVFLRLNTGPENIAEKRNICVFWKRYSLFASVKVVVVRWEVHDGLRKNSKMGEVWKTPEPSISFNAI